MLPILLPSLFLLPFIGMVTGVQSVVMSEPVQQVIVGKNVTVTCTFIPEKNYNPDQLEVEWHLRRRSQWRVILKNKAEQLANKGRQYYGRFWIDPSKLLEGIASLQIKNVLLTDSGEYRCIIMDGGPAAFESSQLIVLAPYTDPQITKHYRETEEFVLQCRSQDGYPKGEIKWFDGNGTELQWKGSTEHILTNEGSFQIVSNMSLTVGEVVRICCSVSHNILFENKMVCHTVIAPYSEPRLNKYYIKEGLILQCRSHGGFPKADVFWHEVGGEEPIKNVTTEQIFTTNENFDVISNLSLMVSKNLHVCCSVFHAILQQNITTCERIMIEEKRHRLIPIIAGVSFVLFILPVTAYVLLKNHTATVI